jgi:endonuclease/exonuclease/phosphatase family metal-dependent hydrolase
MLSITLLATLLVQPIAVQSPPATAQPAATLLVERRLDGHFDDWKVPDPIGYRLDRGGDGAGGPDIIATSLVGDPRHVWLFVEFFEEVTLQGLDVPLHLYLDTDGSRATGAEGGPLPGADLVLVFSPQAALAERGNRPRRSHGEGVEIRAVEPSGRPGPPVLPEVAASLNLLAAPTHASRRFELRLDRSAERFDGRSATMRAVVGREAIKEDGSRVLETLDWIDPVQNILMPRDPSPRPTASAEAVARAEGTDLRVASWNAELGAIFANPEPFAATLRAIAPDVLLLQELGKASRDELVAWLDAHLPGEIAWTALTSGGDLRTAVAARGALQPASFLDGVKRSTDRGDRDVRAVGAVLDRAGRRTLLVSVHLKCCGRIGGDEDVTRLAEAATIAEAIAKAHAAQPFDAIVVGGDLNLVGDRAVLDRLTRGLDLDGSDLDPVEAYHLADRVNTTWRPNKPGGGEKFLPSKLDYILFSGAALETRRAFVFSENDLSAEAAASLALPPSALDRPSDHQPVVVDLRFMRPQP